MKRKTTRLSVRFLSGHDVDGPWASRPEALAAFQRSEIDKWWPIIKAAAVKAE
jgi:hypothetical protein